MADPVKRDIVRYCRLMAEKGPVAGTEGQCQRPRRRRHRLDDADLPAPSFD